MKPPRLPVVLVIAAAAIAVWAVVARASPAEITAGKVFVFYRDFERITKVPRLVAPAIATLCTTRTPTPELISAIRAEIGPHYESRIHIYANAAGAARRTRANDAFPVGAVVVKEKLDNDEKAYAVGGMRKRAPGYDPDNGDWEYFFAGRDGSFSTGKLANCIVCHARVKDADYVFSLRYRVNKNERK